MKAVYAILVKASRIVIVDAESESEAQKLAMEGVALEEVDSDEASTLQANLTPEDIERHLRHDAQDLREVL